MSSNDPAEAFRLDKWLWAARLFKTRALAAVAVDGGKVHLNGARTKPAKQVNVGDLLVIQRGEDERTVRVLALSTRRGPAPVAAMLYEETAESQSARSKRADRRGLMPQAPRADGRPSKRDRRALTRLTRGRY